MKHTCTQNMAPETLGYDETFVIYRQDRNEHGGGLIMLIRRAEWKKS